nr:LLM class F420-dependent oxidoreductase [Chloroflexaceae bacterium]
RNPIPICIGGGGEKVTLKLTAQYAQIWNGFGPAESYKRKNEILDTWCNELGRNPAEIERSIAINGKDLDGLDGLAEAGATHFILGFGEPWDFGAVERLVQWRDTQG